MKIREGNSWLIATFKERLCQISWVAGQSKKRWGISSKEWLQKSQLELMGRPMLERVALVGNLLCWAIQRKDLILGAVCLPEPHKVTFRGERALGIVLVLETTTRENTIGGRGQRKTSYLHSRLLRP